MLAIRTASSPKHEPDRSLPEQQPAKNITSRILKKREIDRRCQRKSREKTKARIAELEGLLKEFQNRDVDGGVAALRRKLEEVEADRSRLESTLRSLESIILGSRSAWEQEPGVSVNVAQHLQTPAIPDPPRAPVESDRSNLDAAFIAFANQNDFRGHHLLESTTTWNSYDFTSTIIPPVPGGGFGGNANSLFADHSPSARSSSFETSCEYLASRSNINNLQPPFVDDFSPSPGIVVPSTVMHSTGCACCAPKTPNSRPSLWRFANDILVGSFRFRGYLNLTDDATNQDIAIRAVLHGWDAVARSQQLPISWQILRRIDETLFSICGDTERLAILQAMHLLLHFHDESTPERHAKLPPWYQKTPSQTAGHSYAINFFAWPGLRERFLVSEHLYCSNEFWDLFASNLRIRWPFSFQDCLTQDQNTGLHSISPLFAQRISDIQNWAMGRGIFERFPEFYSDLPALDPSPRPVSNTTQLRLTMNGAEGNWNRGQVARRRSPHSGSPGDQAIDINASNTPDALFALPLGATASTNKDVAHLRMLNHLYNN